MGTRRCCRARPATLALGLLLVAVPLRAQQRGAGPGPVVRGTVQDADSGIPLGAGGVLLLGSDGTAVSMVLTDDGGRYLLPVPAPGTYRLRAERVGYHALVRGPFTLGGADTLTLDFALSPAPLLLDSLLVSVARRARPLGAGEQLVFGRLLDFETGQPIPQGVLRLLDRRGQSVAGTLSDDEGRFWLVSPRPGAYRLQGERIGYERSTGPELQLMLGDTLRLEFRLSVEAVLLNPLVVTASARGITARYDLSGMEGFLRRYADFGRGGLGEFLTRDSIARYESRAPSTGHMLLQTMMQVRALVPDAMRVGQVVLRGGCIPTYFVEGVEVPPDAVEKDQINPMTMYPPEELEGVEVYVRPNIPAEFLRGEFPCGVVALWRRREPHTPVEAPLWRKLLAGGGILGLGLLLVR